MKRYLILSAAVLLVLLLAPAALPVLAQATSTPTPTATATATSTITPTPALIVTGVTSNNQGYVIQRSLTAGDVALTLAWLIGVALLTFKILLDQTERSG